MSFKWDKNQTSIEANVCLQTQEIVWKCLMNSEKGYLADIPVRYLVH